MVAAYRRQNDLDRISGMRVDMLSSRGGGRHSSLEGYRGSTGLICMAKIQFLWRNYKSGGHGPLCSPPRFSAPAFLHSGIRTHSTWWWWTNFKKWRCIVIKLDQHINVTWNWWKDADEAWKAISSRRVTTWLQVVQCGHRQCGGSKRTSSKYLSHALISAEPYKSFDHPSTFH